MVVVILTAVPPGLRGHLTRWLFEIAPGVYVGYATARVRDFMWDRIAEHADTGRVLMVHSARGEQGLAYRVHEHDWTPVDHDGITLIRRPITTRERFDLGVRTNAATARTAKQTPTDGAVQRKRDHRMKFRKHDK